MNYRKILQLCLVMQSCGCVQNAQSYVEVPLFVAGTAHDIIETAQGTRLSLSRADVAFGPLYFCAGERSGALCDEARLEWLDAVVIPTAEPDAISVGQLVGVTGTVRSWMYDLGISSLLTRESPAVLNAAATLGDVSLVLEGDATMSDGARDVSFAFEASIRAAADPETEQGVPLVRSAATGARTHEVRHGDQLTLVFDPAEWLRGVDFRDSFETETCASVVRPVVCEDQTEHRCSPGGRTLNSRDCPREGLVCVREVGCQESVRIRPGDAAYRALRNALMSTGGPRMIWSEQ